MRSTRTGHNSVTIRNNDHGARHVTVPHVSAGGTAQRPAPWGDNPRGGALSRAQRLMCTARRSTRHPAGRHPAGVVRGQARNTRLTSGGVTVSWGSPLCREAVVAGRPGVCPPALLTCSGGGPRHARRRWALLGHVVPPASTVGRLRTHLAARRLTSGGGELFPWAHRSTDIQRRWANPPGPPPLGRSCARSRYPPAAALGDTGRVLWPGLVVCHGLQLAAQAGGIAGD